MTSRYHGCVNSWHLIVAAALAICASVPTTWACAAGGAPVRVPAGAIVVDDADAGFVRSGSDRFWNSADVPVNDAFGGRMLWTTNTSSAVDNVANWIAPSFAVISGSAAISVEILALIPRTHANTLTATYQIETRSAISTVLINQNAFAADWVSLGVHVFAAGLPAGDATQRVRLTDVTGEPNASRVVGFDAMAFRPLHTAWLTTHLPVLLSGASATSGAPRDTISRYMSTTDPRRLYDMGCGAGRRAEDGIVLLDFGQAWQNETDGRQGTRLFLYDGNEPFRDTAQIAEAARQFVRGYWSCAARTTFLRLGVGTNNFRGATGAAHGAAWGQMLSELASWLASQPELAAQTLFFGANDIEPSWNSAALTRAWVNGYASATSRGLYNYGSCDGCPFWRAPASTPSNGWTVEDVWYVSWGARPAVAVPEIYLENGWNADQWYRISLYGALAHGEKVEYRSLLTQRRACVGRGCNGTANTPAQAWQQLQDALNADPRTRHAIPAVTDITWEN